MRTAVRSSQFITLLFLCALLSACPIGDKGDGGAFCDTVNGGGVTSNCAGCTISDPGRAADGDLYSSADVKAVADAQTITSTIRATAGNGVVYPAGSVAGVFITDDSSVCGQCGGVINTYLKGQAQESSSSLMNSDVNGNGSAAAIYSGLKTTKPFDAVEIVDSSSGGQGNFGTTTPVFRVYEICSNGGVR